MEGIIVNFEGKNISIDNLPETFEFVDEKANLYIKEEAYYFIKKENHNFFSITRFKKSELKKFIEDRGWKGRIIAETANLPYANLLYRNE